MRVQIQSIHFDADVKLTQFIEKKLEKLETFYDRIVEAEVFLKVNKNDSNENKIVEIKLGVPGPDLFAKTQAGTFEQATDEAVEALRRQLKKFKEKLQAH